MDDSDRAAPSTMHDARGNRGGTKTARGPAGSSRVITAPHMGPYTAIILSAFRRLGFRIVKPPPTTSSTYSIGLRAMHELICLPAKVTLGNMVQAQEKGATDVVMWDSCGSCRFKCFYLLQQNALKQMGNPIQVHPIRVSHIVGDLRRMDKGIGRLAALKQTISALKRIHGLDKRKWGTASRDGAIKVGLMGEIYTVNDPTINMNIVKKLKRMGVHVGNVGNFSHFVFKRFYTSHLMAMPFTDAAAWKEADKDADRLFPKDIGGHGKESITSLFYYRRLGYDGAIHLLPFPCMPESTVADAMDIAAAELDFPLLHLVFDEHSADAGLDTRLEAFVDMLELRKERFDPCG